MLINCFNLYGIIFKNKKVSQKDTCNAYRWFPLWNFFCDGMGNERKIKDIREWFTCPWYHFLPIKQSIWFLSYIIIGLMIDGIKSIAPQERLLSKRTYRVPLNLRLVFLFSPVISWFTKKCSKGGHFLLSCTLVLSSFSWQLYVGCHYITFPWTT